MTIASILALHNRIGEHERVFELGDSYKQQVLGDKEYGVLSTLRRASPFRNGLSHAQIAYMVLVPYLQSCLEMGELQRFDDTDSLLRSHYERMRKTRILTGRPLDPNPTLNVLEIQRNALDLKMSQAEVIEAIQQTSKEQPKVKVKRSVRHTELNPLFVRGVSLLELGFMFRDAETIRANLSYSSGRSMVSPLLLVVFPFHFATAPIALAVGIPFTTCFFGEYAPYMVKGFYHATISSMDILPTGSEQFYEAYASYLEGNYDRAETHFAKFLEERKSGLSSSITSSDEYIWSAYDALGDLHEKEGESAYALQCYTKAIDASELERGLLRRDSYKRNFLMRRSHPYERATLITARNGDVEGAFHVAERTKSRALLDLLEGKEVGKTEEVSASYVAYRKASATPTLDITKGDSKRKALPGIGSPEDMRRSVEEARGQLAQADKELASMVNVDAPEWKDIAPLLDADTWLVEFFTAEDESLVFVGKSGQLSVIPLGKSAKEIKELAQEVRKAIAPDAGSGDASAMEDALTAGRKAYDALLGKALADGCPNRLVIVPHGALHLLPFGALHDGSKWLAESCEFTVLPCSGVLPYCLQRERPSITNAFVIGNPDLSVTWPTAQTLPSAEDEARAVAGMLGANVELHTGADATEQSFKGAAPNASIIHLACHAMFDPRSPSQSALLLAAGQSEDGRLEVWESMKTSLNARLVTLSACETAMGEISPGDDVVGLTRGMLYAGTPTVVASLWQVHDSATKDLMMDFYQHYLAGEGAAASLRSAQLALMGRAGQGKVVFQRGIAGVVAAPATATSVAATPAPVSSIEAEAPYAHPYFWAGFQANGAWN